jgi:hypothetical protein
MSALTAALLLAAAVAAQDSGSEGNMNDGGRYGQDQRRQAAERKGPRQSSAHIPRDEGSKLYEPPPGAEAASMPPSGPDDAPPAQAAPAALSPEDALDNIRTLLETRLARTGGVWKVRDNRTGKPRGLALQELRDAKDEGQGRWSARALFRDKAGAAHAKVLADLSGERWRVLKLEPAAPPAAPPKKPAAR